MPAQASIPLSMKMDSRLRENDKSAFDPDLGITLCSWCGHWPRPGIGFIIRGMIIQMQRVRSQDYGGPLPAISQVSAFLAAGEAGVMQRRE